MKELVELIKFWFLLNEKNFYYKKNSTFAFPQADVA